MDLLVVMESGRVAQMGTYQEILSKTKNLTNLLQAFSEQEKGEDTMKNKPKIQCANPFRKPIDCLISYSAFLFIHDC